LSLNLTMKQSSTETRDIDRYFSGEALYGDDFSDNQLRLWYEQEKEGYSNIVSADPKSYEYKYHELNKYHLFRHIRLDKPAVAIGLGSAYGDEFTPIAGNLSKIVIIEPSDKLSAVNHRNGLMLEYCKPGTDGKLYFEDNYFSVATSFGTLHHIANVSFVLSELYRCLKPGGYLLLREPIVTQGDWRQPRRGLTKNERGLPYNWLLKTVSAIGFEIHRKALFDFAPFTKLIHFIGIPAFTSSTATKLDRFLSVLFSFNKRYHRTKFLHKFGPASVAMVLCKPVNPTD
jgi:SAM-dependent methyltransferase